MNKVLHTILFVALGIMMVACNGIDNNSNTYPDSATRSIAQNSDFTVTDAVSSLEIDWITGPIQLLPTDDDHISFHESSNMATTPKTALYYETSADGELSIQYCKDEIRTTGKDFPKKSLTVFIPRSMQLFEVEINGVGGMIEIDSILCDELSIDGVNFNTTAHFDRLPSRIDCDGVSQELHLYAPEGSRIFAEADGVHAKVINEAHCTKQQAQCRISADGVDCKVEVKINK